MSQRVVYRDGLWNGRPLEDWVPEVVADLAAAADPLKIILFGSSVVGGRIRWRVLRGASRPAVHERSVAVFGALDGDHPTEHKLFNADTTAIPGALLDQLAEELGVLVIPAAPATDGDLPTSW